VFPITPAARKKAYRDFYDKNKAPPIWLEDLHLLCEQMDLQVFFDFHTVQGLRRILFGGGNVKLGQDFESMVYNAKVGPRLVFNLNVNEEIDPEGTKPEHRGKFQLLYFSIDMPATIVRPTDGVVLEVPKDQITAKGDTFEGVILCNSLKVMQRLLKPTLSVLRLELGGWKAE
jgi:hypothetical protein